MEKMNLNQALDFVFTIIFFVGEIWMLNLLYHIHPFFLGLGIVGAGWLSFKYVQLKGIKLLRKRE